MVDAVDCVASNKSSRKVVQLWMSHINVYIDSRCYKQVHVHSGFYICVVYWTSRVI